jgi:hypothetical protein
MRYRSKAAASKLDGQEGVARPPVLRALFPAVTQLRLELRFVADLHWEPSAQVHILHPPSAASFRYPCPIAGCNGHFDLQESVMQLLQQTNDSAANTIYCSGVRPEDRSTGRLCGLQLRYQIRATYLSRVPQPS